MNQRVAIVGAAQAKFSANKSDQWQGDVAYEALEQALQQTGLTFQDRDPNGFGIDRILTCAEDHYVGKTCNTFLIHHYIGAYGLSVDNVSGDTATAVNLAAIDILSGHYDIVLVIGINKESETLRPAIENCYFDHIFLQPLGLDYLIASALQAQKYMHTYNISREQCALAAVKSRSNARNNPYAQAPMDITVDDVLKSEMLASPISVLDARPAVSDGAVAIILASEETAKKITDKPVWIKGIANCYGRHHLGDRDLTSSDSLVTAAKKAYSMAGINNPLKEIDVAEISAEYSYQELLWSEGLGFCEKGGGGTFIDKGFSTMSGDLPINPSGGFLAGNPLGVAGGARVVEAVIQLREEGDARQVQGARTALAHGFTGACGQTHCVMILGR